MHSADWPGTTLAKAALLFEPAGSAYTRQSAAFFDAVRAGYLALAAEPEPRFHLLDAACSADALEDEIWQKIRPALT